MWISTLSANGGVLANPANRRSISWFLRTTLLLRLPESETRKLINAQPVWKVTFPSLCNAQYDSLPCTFVLQWMKENGQFAAYNDLIRSTFENVTPPTLRYAIGYLVQCELISPNDFVHDIPLRVRSHRIKTTWPPKYGIGKDEERIEQYRNDCIAPCSAIVWLRNRVGLLRHQGMLSTASLTQWNLQNIEQHRALTDSWWQWYTVQRYISRYTLHTL